MKKFPQSSLDAHRFLVQFLQPMSEAFETVFCFSPPYLCLSPHLFECLQLCRRFIVHRTKVGKLT